MVRDVDEWVVSLGVLTDEKRTEAWLGEDVENAVKDSLRFGADDVASLAQSPSDWVQEPQRDCPDTAKSVDLADIGTKGTSVSAPLENNSVGDEEESDATKGEVSPLVGALDESTNETGDDHDFIEENGVGDGWSGQTACQEEILRIVSLQLDFHLVSLTKSRRGVVMTQSMYRT